MSPEIDGKSHLKTSWNPPSSRTQRWDSTGIFLYVWKWFLINPTKRFGLCAILLVCIYKYIYRHPYGNIFLFNPLIVCWFQISLTMAIPSSSSKETKAVIIHRCRTASEKGADQPRPWQETPRPCVLFPLCLFFCWWIGVHCLCLMGWMDYWKEW